MIKSISKLIDINADWNTGTLTDVVAVNDGLELDNHYPCDNPLYSSSSGNLFTTPTVKDGSGWIILGTTTSVNANENNNGYTTLETDASTAGIYQEFSGLSTTEYYTCSYLVKYISGSQLIGSHFDSPGSAIYIRIDGDAWIEGTSKILVPDDNRYHLVEKYGYMSGTTSDRVFIQPGRQDDSATSSKFEIVYGRFEKGIGAQKIEFRKNIALGKTVITDNPDDGSDGTAPEATDGIIDTLQWTATNMDGGTYRELDLGEVFTINKFKMWHYWGDGRTYYDNIVEVSSNGNDWVEIFNSNTDGEYSETLQGKLIEFEPKKVRYIKNYINGSTSNTINHWVELKASKSLSTGNRLSGTIDLSVIDNVEASTISWSETLNGEAIDVETSVDGGLTWQTAINGSSILNLTAIDTTLDVRQTLSTTDTTVTPRLIDLYWEVISSDTDISNLNSRITSVRNSPIFKYGGLTTLEGNIYWDSRSSPIFKEGIDSIIKVKFLPAKWRKAIEIINRWQTETKPTNNWQSETKLNNIWEG